MALAALAARQPALEFIDPLEPLLPQARQRIFLHPLTPAAWAADHFQRLQFPERRHSHLPI